MTKITITFASTEDLIGIRDILYLTEHCISIKHAIIRRRVLKQIEKRLKNGNPTRD